MGKRGLSDYQDLNPSLRTPAAWVSHSLPICLLYFCKRCKSFRDESGINKYAHK